MKKVIYRLTATFLVLVLLSGFMSAFAVRTDYADIKGHWAEGTLIRALGDSLIEGSGNSLNPDAPMTAAELIHILCNVLAAQTTADISSVTDITKDDPSYADAQKAVALGLMKPENNLLNLNKPVTRGKAFIMLTEAFQLSSAEPDTSVLDKFTDVNTLTGQYRSALSALVSGGFVQGKAGALNLTDTISRAEFLTVFYNILPDYSAARTVPATSTGGIVLSGTAPVSDTTFAGTVYFDGSSTSVQLRNITAPAVVLRSDSLQTLSLLSCNINRLVLSQGSGDVSVSPRNAVGTNLLSIGTGGGKITLGYGLTNAEITGSNRDVTITGPLRTLLISGSNNNVTFMSGGSADTVKILGSGTGNTMTVNGTIGMCSVFGQGTVLTGTGSIQELRDNAADSAVTVTAVNTYTNKDYGLNTVALALSAPDEIPLNETLKASVSVSAPAGSKLCRGAWYLDDRFISGADIDIGASPSVSLNSDITNTGITPGASTLSFVLSYTDTEGNYQEIRTGKTVTLTDPTKPSTSDVLALVTTGYKGNYTLAWAKSHDYDAAVKTAWVNAKGYASKTQYLVWVSIAYQRVNIFKGSAGKWVLDRTFIVGTGATGKDTPTGVFKVIGRSTKGWTTKAYTVKPVIFFISLAYGFHSRLYDPGTTTINDARIGFPVSHGCIRMYDEDVAWIYQNIKANTTVVVY